MEMFEYLSRYKEHVPKWLAGDDFSLANFFASRTAVYPGTGRDGHAIEIFNRSHSAHCFVCIDRVYRTDQIRQELAPGSYEGSDFYIRGYNVIFERDLPQEIPGTQPVGDYSAFHLCIYQRNLEYDDDYGAERIALLLVGAEAHATYQWLYERKFAANPPFGVLLQDHEFGGDFSRYKFGNSRTPMVKTARANGWPRFIVVGDGTNPWPGFVKIAGVKPSVGGMHSNMRVLYECGTRLSRGTRRGAVGRERLMTTYRIQNLRELRDEMKAVACGQKPAPADAARPSFNSVEALVRLLTPENRRLLSLIRDRKPESMTELREWTGRAQPNLSRTLAKLEAAGLVTMKPGNGRRKIPQVRVRKITVEIDSCGGQDHLQMA